MNITKTTVTDKSKNITDLLQQHEEIRKKDVLDIIEERVCEHYMITKQQFRARLRKKPIPTAKRMYFMLVLDTVGCVYQTLASKVSQSHCMVVHAKKDLIEIDQPWNKELLQDYEAINKEIEAEIRKKFVPDIKPSQPDYNLLAVLVAVGMSAVNTTAFQPSMMEAREKFFKVLDLWIDLEKIGSGEEVQLALEKIKSDKIKFPLNPDKCYQVLEEVPQNIP